MLGQGHISSYFMWGQRCIIHLISSYFIFSRNKCQNGAGQTDFSGAEGVECPPDTATTPLFSLGGCCIKTAYPAMTPQVEFGGQRKLQGEKVQKVDDTKR